MIILSTVRSSQDWVGFDRQHNLGFLYQQRGNLAAAREAYEKALLLRDRTPLFATAACVRETCFHDPPSPISIVSMVGLRSVRNGRAACEAHPL